MTNPTVRGLRLPTHDTDIVNKLYADRKISSFLAYVPASSNVNSDSSLALDTVDAILTTNGQVVLSPTAASAFFSDPEAAHPRSHKPASRYQIDFTYPSIFTETQRSDNDDDQTVTQYFVETHLFRDGETFDSSAGLQTILEVPNVTNAGGQLLGTIGGVFTRYRDKSQFASEWSNWQRLDNRELDAQFARVDYLKFDGNTISVDALTPFANNLQVPSGATPTDATKVRRATQNLSLHLAAKGSGVLRFGVHDNALPTGGAQNFNFQLSISGSEQVIQGLGSSSPLFFTTASWFDFSGATLTAISQLRATDVRLAEPTALLKVGQLDIRANSTQSSDTTNDITFTSGNNSITFGSNHTLSAINSLTIGNHSGSDTRVASNRLSTEANLTLGAAGSGVIDIRDSVINIGQLRAGNLILNDANVNSVSGNITLDAASNVIDLNNSDLLQIANGSEIDEITAERFQVQSSLLFNDNRVATTQGDLVLRSAGNFVDFSGARLTNIANLTVDNTLFLTGNAISANALKFETTGAPVISLSNNSVKNVAKLQVFSFGEVNGLTFDNNTVAAPSRIYFLTAADRIDFNDNQFDVGRIDAGSFDIRASQIHSNNANGIVLGADQSLDFDGSTLDDINSVVIDNNFTISTNGIASSAANDLLITSNQGLVLNAGGNIDLGGKMLTVTGTPNSSSDALTKSYADTRELGVNHFADVDGTLDMNNHKIIDHDLSPNASHVGATFKYMDDQRTISGLTSDFFDMRGNRFLNLSSPDDLGPNGGLLKEQLSAQRTEQIILTAFAKFTVNNNGHMTYIDSTPTGYINNHLKFVYVAGTTQNAAGKDADGTNATSGENANIPADDEDDQRSVGFYWDEASRRRALVSINCMPNGAIPSSMPDSSFVLLALRQYQLDDFTFSSRVQANGSFAAIELYDRKNNVGVAWADDQTADVIATTAMHQPDTNRGQSGEILGVYPVANLSGAESVLYNNIQLTLPAQTAANRTQRRLVAVVAPTIAELRGSGNSGPDGRLKNYGTYVDADVDHPQDYSPSAFDANNNAILSYCHMLVRIIPERFIQ